MKSPNLFVLSLLFLAISMCMPGAARAAESYDNCTGFITSLPTVITTQGTWCMKSDLTTAVTSGNAITVNTSNVTIDCNDFKLGGLAAGLGTNTTGIRAIDRQNMTVRHCNIRGFLDGIHVTGSASGGHVIEDNRFSNNTYSGIYLEGDGSVLRRNLVTDTGGSTTSSTDTTAIWTVDSVDILDNTVSNSTATVGSSSAAFGIYSYGNLNGRIVGNGVTGVAADGSASAFAITTPLSDRVTLRDNDVIGNGSSASAGVSCNTANGRALGNVISGFSSGLVTCSDDGGNVIVP
jgi:parallel beta-helix repeat protein